MQDRQQRDNLLPTSPSKFVSSIRGVVANYLAFLGRDPRIDSRQQQQKDSWHL